MPGLAYWLVYWSPDIMVALTGLVALYGLVYSCITSRPLDVGPLDRLFESHGLDKDEEHHRLYSDLADMM